MTFAPWADSHPPVPLQTLQIWIDSRIALGFGTVDAAPDHAVLLRRHGLQVTTQRRAVLQAVAERPHSTAAEIGSHVRQAIGTVSPQAVYDALSTLADNGIIRRIQPAGSPARYEDRVGDNHHHLICRSCGQMVDVDCAVGFAPCLTASEDAGYEIHEAEVIFWGRCPACTAATAASAQHHETASQ
jgi:Fur family ferric uptake transcriptional regulator